MRRVAFLVLLLAAGCARKGRLAEREVTGVGDQVEWQAEFVGSTLKTIHEKQTQDGRTSAKNVYWFEGGRLRLYDSQRGMSALHVLFDSTGHVTKFSKREDGRAVAVEPAEVQKVLARADSLAAEARKVAAGPR